MATFTDLRFYSLNGYAILTENNSSGNPVYVAEAVPSSIASNPVWRIKKISYDANGNFSKLRWADGVATFIKIWDDRATYTYG